MNSSYRDYGNNNLNVNSNPTRNFYGNSPSHFSDATSGYVPSALGGGSNNNNSYNYSNPSNNIYSFSAANNNANGAGGGYSMGSASFGLKNNQSANTTTNANTLTNKNIYDFNHVRQPVRNLGLPAPKFDNKY